MRRIQYGSVGEYSPADIVEDFKIANLGLYTTASVLLPHLQDLAETEPNTHLALFVTSGAIIHQPIAPVFSLCMAQAAQPSLARVLADQNKGVVHVALVAVGGQVSAEEEVNNPENIATKFWELYTQKRGSWKFEKKCGWEYGRCAVEIV